MLPYLTEPGAESPFVLSLLCDSGDEDTGAPAFSLEPVRPPQTEPTTDGPRPWRQPTPPSSPMTSPRLATKLTDAFAASAHYVCVQVRPETDWHTSRVTAPWSAAATPPTTEAFFGNLQVVSPPPLPASRLPLLPRSATHFPVTWPFLPPPTSFPRTLALGPPRLPHIVTPPFVAVSAPSLDRRSCGWASSSAAASSSS